MKKHIWPVIGAGCLLLSMGHLRSEDVLFSEDFTSEESGRPWAGYNGWEGSDAPRVWKVADRGVQGTFLDASMEPATMSVKLPSAYPVEGHVYELTFEIRGTIARGFQVTLGSTEEEFVGLQLGVRDANVYQIAAVSISPNGTKKVYADGGYYSDTSAPPGYSKGQSYHVAVTINGSSRDLKADGRVVAAHQGLLEFNRAGEGGMPAYAVSFDLPPNLTDIAQLRVEKVATTVARWSVGHIKLTQIAAP